MSVNQTSTKNTTVEFLAAAEQPPQQDNSVGIELGDVDGDGDLDAFVVNYNNQTNQLLINDGRGNFSTATTSLPGTKNSNDVSLGDVDGDGDLDAFVVNNAQANQLLLNDGQGVFFEVTGQLPSTDNDAGYGVELGDVDGDGDLDAFVVNYWGQANQLLLNDGQGGFTESVTQLPGNKYSTDISLGDLDGDGDLDAFVVNYNRQANQVLLNDGEGRFTAAAIQPSGSGYSTGVTLGDVDGDGDLDAFVANYKGQSNQLLLNAGDGSFTESAIQPVHSSYSNDASFGDLDGDGDLDVLVVNDGGTNQILLNDGNGVFAEVDVFSDKTNSYGVALGDLDQDGDVDSLVVNRSEANQVLLNNGTNYTMGTQGIFTAGEQGLMSLDYLYDGGAFQGELAVFAIEGMVDLRPGSEAFIQEAAQRALSGSQGYVLIQDGQDAARFNDSVGWESDFNQGHYQGLQQFSLEAGTQFAVMLVQNGSVSELAENPELAQQTGQSAIFSIPEANQGSAVATRLVAFNGQAAEGNGLYGMEDSNLAAVGDRDYNDIVFQIKGATSDVVAAEDKTNKSRNFAKTPVGQSILDHANRNHVYTEGTFIVGESAEVTVDFLFDGGGFNKGELGLFNLSGMENYTLGSEAFLQEAARRATSASNLGHVVIQDRSQAARFQADLSWERNFNDGVHAGAQTYQMKSGDQFAVILSQNISLAQLADDPKLAAQFGKQALFSIPEANPGNNLTNQMVDLNGLGSEGNGIYGIEDIQVTKGGGDRDYNDLVFQLQGATSVANTEAKFRAGRDWRNLSIGEDILDFATQSFDQHLQGTQGRDVLTGSLGNDLLEGYKGRDVLQGGLGDDILTGGSGEDTFVLEANAGTDTITDFTQNYDVLGMLSGITFSDLAFAGNDIFQKGSNNILATLSGFDTTQLTASDFIGI